MSAPGYLVVSFFRQIWDFIYDWYAGGFFAVGHHLLNILRQMDQVFGWRANAANFFQPLYQDYSAIGYVFGIIFRFGRLIVASAVYLFVFILATAIYVFWATIPAYLVYRLIFNLL